MHNWLWLAIGGALLLAVYAPVAVWIWRERPRAAPPGPQPADDS